jgi:hypothetical protein
MAALTIERLTDFEGTVPSRRTIPMKASTKVFKGGMVAIDASGNAMPAGLIAGGSVRVRGVATHTADNSAGIAGALKVEVHPGVWTFNNSSAGDLIAMKDCGAVCYVVDDNTVALTNGTSTRITAGTIEHVNADGTVRVLLA